MSKIKALTFREKQEVLKKVFSQYKRAKIKLHCLQQSSYYPQIKYGVIKESNSHYQRGVIDRLNEQIDNKDELEKIIFTFECIIDTLNEDSRRIITNDFISTNSPNWWYEYYSKSTYYRMKTKAMEEVLFYLHI